MARYSTPNTSTSYMQKDDKPAVKKTVKNLGRAQATVVNDIENLRLPEEIDLPAEGELGVIELAHYSNSSDLVLRVDVANMYPFGPDKFGKTKTNVRLTEPGLDVYESLEKQIAAKMKTWFGKSPCELKHPLYNQQIAVSWPKKENRLISVKLVAAGAEDSFIDGKAWMASYDTVQPAQVAYRQALWIANREGKYVVGFFQHLEEIVLE